MSKFNDLCKQVAAGYKAGGYLYNWGAEYIGITFNTYEQMWAFKKTDLYKELLPYKIDSQYTKYIYFAKYPNS